MIDQDITSNDLVQVYPRVLCFTCSTNRPLFIRNCILQVQAQSIAADHVIYINHPKAKDENETTNYQYLLDDIKAKKNTTIQIQYGATVSQHKNHMAALTLANINNYDLFLKIDDDDIYRTDYIKQVVDSFKEEKWDFSGQNATGILNGIHFQKNAILECLGENELDIKYNVPKMMPGTYAFSQKAIKLLQEKMIDQQQFEDPQWRVLLAKEKHIKTLKRNGTQYIYHIHGKNISTSHHLIKND